jgi:hypothetical protein
VGPAASNNSGSEGKPRNRLRRWSRSRWPEDLSVSSSSAEVAEWRLTMWGSSSEFRGVLKKNISWQKKTIGGTYLKNHAITIKKIVEFINPLVYFFMQHNKVPVLLNLVIQFIVLEIFSVSAKTEI